MLKTPYLSVVVTARNDDHGGNLLGRMQAFVNGWIAQSNRDGLSSELIIVEWNPPADRPPLARALQFPADPGACRIRFISVPARVHQKFRHASVLPLYQMIAKNVGIRRSRGAFVLATNIDILFSSELIRFFAERRLQTGCMYRIDRRDVMSHVPVNASPETQLTYCERNMLRINSRQGTFKVTSDGRPALEEHDIATHGSGIAFGSGWFGVERESPSRVFRWAHDRAEIRVQVPSHPASPLELEIEAGPGVGQQPFVLQLIDAAGTVQDQALVGRNSALTICLPQNVSHEAQFWLRALDGGMRIAGDPRVLDFRVFRCAWGEPTGTAASSHYQLKVSPSRFKQRSASPFAARTAANVYRFCAQVGKPWKIPAVAARYFVRARKLQVKLPPGADVFDRGAGIWPGSGWHFLEHAFGETFRWAGKSARLIIQSVSGERALEMVVEPGPGVGYQPFELLAKNERGTVIARALVKGLERIRFSVPLRPGRQMIDLTLEGGGIAAPADPRIMNFRVFWCGWAGPGAQPAAGPASGQTEPMEASELPSPDDSFESTPVFLHTNACGDFTLMAREHWLDVRGYPEFDAFSMNIDSILCYAAYHAGVNEEVLEDPMRIYHIEHAKGSGWTPEGQEQLFARLQTLGIPFIGYPELLAWAIQMRRLNSPMIFNRDDWGLGGIELEETGPEQASSVSAGTGGAAS